MFDNVNNVVSNRLCMGCGTCVSGCPAGCIQMRFSPKAGQFLPEIQLNRCIHCHTCLDVCPGLSVHFDALNKARFGHIPEQASLGHYQQCYTGFSRNEQLRFEGASGGVITQLLTYYFDHRKIEAVIVTKPSRDYWMKPEVFCCTHQGKLKNSQKSIYTNVPLNAKLKQLSDMDCPYAFVGLPCHVHGLLKLFKIDAKLKKNCVIILGLICSGAQKVSALLYYFSRLKIDPNSIRSVDYRAGGFPGQLRLHFRNKDSKLLPRRFSDKKSRLAYGSAFNGFFHLDRCFSCFDKLNTLADISLGDPWLKRFENECVGQNIVLARSHAGNHDIQNAQDEGYLSLEPASIEDVVCSQKVIHSKYDQVDAYRSVYQLLSRPFPVYEKHQRQKAMKKKAACLIALLDQVRLRLAGLRLIWPLLSGYFNLETQFRHFLLPPQKYLDRPIKGKPVRILISEADLVGNKGAEAMILALIHLISRQVPNTEFIILTKFFQDVQNYIQKNHLDVTLVDDSGQKVETALARVWIWWLLKRLGMDFTWLLNHPLIHAYRRSDLVLSVSGISFIDDFGMVKIYHFSKYLQVPLLLNLPVIKYTQSLGPMKTVYNRVISRLLLPLCDTVMARGTPSVSHLEAIGVKKNVKKFPDITFILEPKPIEALKKEVRSVTKHYQTIVGVSVNVVCEMLDNEKIYSSSMARLLDSVLDDRSTFIFMIPHSTLRVRGKKDDFLLTKEIMDLMQNKDRICLFDTYEYTAAQIKWIISQCSLFIGSRFHALLASLSTCVPSMAIGWQVKYFELMEWVDQMDYVSDFRMMKHEELKMMYQSLFKNRSHIRAHLRKRKEVLTALVEESGHLIHQTLMDNISYADH